MKTFYACVGTIGRRENRYRRVFVQLPNGQHYAISVFVKSSHTDMPNTEKMIPDISRITYRNICNHH